ncbi:hypothetical protein NDU88_003788 [Pleurodeles waltl]|uniref:Uncharacterized protein n=1 Tax=Pleurodeles waltl TaxID=8319 RepID=A0AAV7SGX1_PLEWA|nr:hypothetical protein NDU88_003788 [Pleurodeles waltl]
MHVSWGVDPLRRWGPDAPRATGLSSTSVLPRATALASIPRGWRRGHLVLLRRKSGQIRLWGRWRPFLAGRLYSSCLPLRTATAALPGLCLLQSAQGHAASTGSSLSGLSTDPSCPSQGHTSLSCSGGPLNV